MSERSVIFKYNINVQTSQNNQYKRKNDPRVISITDYKGVAQADQHFLFLYFDLAKTSFDMCGSYVSAAIYCRANLYTCFVNTKENQHKGATTQFIQYESETAMTGTHLLLQILKRRKASYL